MHLRRWPVPELQDITAARVSPPHCGGHPVKLSDAKLAELEGRIRWAHDMGGEVQDLARRSIRLKYPDHTLIPIKSVSLDDFR